MIRKESFTASYLLSSSIPNIESHLSTVGVEQKRVDFTTKSSDVSLLELASHVSLHEGSLADSSIANEDKLELRNEFLFLLLLCVHCLSMIVFEMKRNERRCSKGDVRSKSGGPKRQNRCKCSDLKIMSNGGGKMKISRQN